MFNFVRFLISAYLRTRSDSALRILIYIAQTGIAISALITYLAFSALLGIQKKLEQRILDSLPHMEIYSDNVSDLLNSIPQDVISYVRESSIFFREKGWIVSGNIVEPVTVIAYYDKLPFFLHPLNSYSVASSYLDERVISSIDIYEKGFVELVLPKVTLSPMGLTPLRIPLSVEGVLKNSEVLDEQFLALDIKKLPFPENDTKVLAFLFKDPYVAIDLKEKLQSEFPYSAIYTWKDLNKEVYFAFVVERVILGVFITLIFLLSSISVLVFLVFMTTLKKRDISILEFIGIDRGVISYVFGGVGVVTVSKSALVGLLVALPTAYFLDKWRVVSLPRKVYFVDYLPFEVSLLLAILILFIASCIGFLFSLIFVRFLDYFVGERVVFGS